MRNSNVQESLNKKNKENAIEFIVPT
jgi:hypothetical protein